MKRLPLLASTVAFAALVAAGAHLAETAPATASLSTSLARHATLQAAAHTTPDAGTDTTPTAGGAPGGVPGAVADVRTRRPAAAEATPSSHLVPAGVAITCPVADDLSVAILLNPSHHLDTDFEDPLALAAICADALDH